MLRRIVTQTLVSLVDHTTTYEIMSVTSSDNSSIIAISAATAAVICALIIAVLIGYALRLKRRRSENNANSSHRYRFYAGFNRSHIKGFLSI